MTDFLTHDQVSPFRFIVGGLIEIGVVHLGDSLGDVEIAGNPDLSDAQPAVVAIF